MIRNTGIFDIRIDIQYQYIAIEFRASLAQSSTLRYSKINAIRIKISNKKPSHEIVRDNKNLNVH